MGRCSGVLGAVCASYPTSKGQRESDKIPQLSWEAPGNPWQSVPNGVHRHRQCPCTASSEHQGTGSEPCPPRWNDGCCSQHSWHFHKAAKPGWVLCLQGNSGQGMNGALLCSPLLPLPPTAPPSPSFLLLFFFVRMNVICPWLHYYFQMLLTVFYG